LALVLPPDKTEKDREKMEEWIGSRDACERLGVTLRDLYRLIDNGQIPAYKMGRVVRLRSDDVAAFTGDDGDGEGDDGGALIPARPKPPPSFPGQETPRLTRGGRVP
jgi:excisionase family DNA binding protein